MRTAITDKLRNKGNYMHNLRVIEQNSNEQLIPRKRPDNNKYIVDNTTHVVCKYCYGLFKKELLFSHVKNCCYNTDTKNDETIDESGKEIRHRVLKTSALMLWKDIPDACDTLKTNIFPRMERDKISMTAQTDPLIVKFGARILRNHRDSYQVSYVSVRMRDLAKCLIKMQEYDTDIRCLENCITPLKFDNLMCVIRQLSGFNETTGECSTPSLAPRLGPSLKACADIIRSSIVKNYEIRTPDKQRSCKIIDEFLQLMRTEWKIEISSNAEKSRKRQKVSKADVLPDSSDIVLVCTKLSESYTSLIKKLELKPSPVSYDNLAKTVIAHLIILNRRRPGEVVRARLHHYTTIYDNEKVNSLNNMVLTEEEKKSAEELMLFHVPGKNVRKVPCLITKIMKKAIDSLLTSRKKVGVDRSDFLFPNPVFYLQNGVSPTYDGTKIIDEVKQQYNLKNPKDFTATGLRHHCASMSQILGVNERYVNHLANFMGHDRNIHESNYNIPLPLIQKGQVGHRLLQMTQSVMCSRTESLNEPCKDNMEVVLNDNTITAEGEEKGESLYIASTNGSLTSEVEGFESTPSCKKIKRVRWNDEEKHIIYRHFGKNLLRFENPERAEIKKVFENEITLKNRSFEQVCSFVNNIVTKKVVLRKSVLREIKAMCNTFIDF